MRFILLLLPSLALGATVRDATTANPAKVNTSNQLNVTLAYDGGSIGPAEMKSGGPVGANRGPNVMGVGLQRLASEEDDVLFYDPVDGATMNTNLWGGSAVTMTVTQTVANGIRLNAGSSTSTTTNVLLISNQPLPYTMESSLACRWRFRINNTGQINQQMEVGLGDVAGTAAPTAGSFFRWNNAGNFVAVVSQNSTETQSASITAPTANVFHTGMIVKHSNDSEFYVDDVLLATVSGATTDPNTWDDQRPNFFMRDLIAGSSPGTAPIYDQGMTACYGTIAASRDYATQLASIGRKAYQSPTSTSSFGQTSNHTNSTSPSSASLSNTAAGYTTLGGRYQFAAVGGAATDFALFGFQVPADVQLWVTSIRINTCLTGAAIATTATLLDWGVGINSSAVSLATADALGPPATAWAPRRIPLGAQGFALVAPQGPAQIGYCANDIVVPFSPPLVVDGTRFFHVILQVPVGTATGSQVFRGDVFVDGVFQ